MSRFSSQMQLEWVERAIKRLPLASKALRSGEMDLEEQIGLVIVERYRKAIEAERKREPAAERSLQ